MVSNESSLVERISDGFLECKLSVYVCEVTLYSKVDSLELDVSNTGVWQVSREKCGKKLATEGFKKTMLSLTTHILVSSAKTVFDEL